MSEETASPTAPVDILLKREARVLEIAFADGARFALPAEYLRVESPSAEVQGHGPSQRKLVARKGRVGFAGAEPVGTYAIRLIFDDGHDTGIYTWRYLRELGEEQTTRWAAYLAKLEAAGLSRGV